MWLSAASLLAVVASGQATVQLPVEEQRAWDRIGRSVAVLESGGFATGAAALLDAGGAFLAHRSVVSGDRIAARLPSGKMVTLNLVFTDEPTQLALLQAETWTNSDMTPIAVTDGTGLVGRAMLAALPGGPIRGEYITSDRAGIVRPSLRYVPLSEIRFETPDQRFGGALVFSYDGRLTGVISASLEPATKPEEISAAKGLTAGGIDSIIRDRSTPGLAQRFGPGTMTVSYSLGPDILRRVVDGFRSPSRRPAHPSIGCFFRDRGGEGALIEAILSRSPAEVGGMLVGDVIIKANDTTITGVVDLAVFLFRQEPGARISLTARRGTTMVILPITVGRQE